MEAKHIEGITVKEYNKATEAGELINYQSYLISENGKTPHQAVWFDTVKDLVELVETNNIYGGNGTFTDRGLSGFEDRADWRYDRAFPSREATCKALISGEAPNTLLNKIDAVKAGLYDRHPELFELERSALKIKRKRAHGESGDELNIDRYMSGDPAMWQYMSRRPQKQSMRISYNGWMNCGQDPDKFVTNMTLLCAFIDIIEMAGITCELWYAPMSQGVSDETRLSMTFAKIKQADEPVDMSRILSCGSSGLLRYYLFKMNSNLLKGNTSRGQGTQADVPSWFREMYDFDVCVGAGWGESQILTVFTTALKNLQ